MDKQENLGIEFRRFNRFYTDVLGFLNEHIYDSPFSLSETRILYEIYNSKECTAKNIQEKLNLDGGYVSRIIKKFEKEKMIYKVKCKEDGRNHLLFVTDHGKVIYKELEKKANEQVNFILQNLDSEKREKLISSMTVIQEILSDSLLKEDKSTSLRSYYISEDIKMMIEQQWNYYRDVCQWDESFLTYLHKTFDDEIERIWIAEIERQFAGCIGLVNTGNHIGQLRWFFVNPHFQNKGIGKLLIESIIQYCKNHNYKKLILWTVSDMGNARVLYKKLGFEITIEKERTKLWGKELVEERWDLEI